jgi:predicted DNA-binding WGR domain protein
LKLIKSIQLFFQEDNSDKVYEIELIESGADAYVVNFRYGRRGSVLKEGTKTIFPVALAEAEKLFKAVETEKRKKGYEALGENSNFIADITPQKPDKTSNQRHKAIIKLLKAAINDEAHETWPTSRIIWRSGELAIPEAAPLILKLVDKKNHLQLYSCIWALSRIANTSSLPFFKEILQQTYPAYILNLAQAAFLNVCDEETQKAEVKALALKLPESLNHAISSNDAFLNAYVKDLFTKFGSGSADFLVPFYFVSINQKRLRNAFVSGIKHIPIKAGYFKFVRQVFKISEMLNDTEVYGILVKIIEQAPYNFSSTHTYIDNKWKLVAEELKKENSTLAFSKKTKEYFSRRIVRTLDRLGNDKSLLYIKYATDILLTFDDEEDNSMPEKTSKYNYIYDSVNRNYITEQKITWFDSHSNHNALYFILYANSTRYTLKNKKIKWECVLPYEPGKLYEPMREEAFASLWNNAPEDIIKILSNTECERVADFALFVFKNNKSFIDSILENDIIACIKNRFIKIQELGFELVKTIYSSSTPSTLIISALLLSQLEQARKYAQDFVEKDPIKFANDEELITSILLSENYSSHQWLHGFLLQHKSQNNVLQKVLIQIIEAANDEKFSGKNSQAESIIKIIESVFKDAVLLLEPNIILDLLLHPDSVVQGLAGTLLVLRNIDPALIKDSTIFSLLESNNALARKAAVNLLNQLDAKALSEKQNLVLSLCLSPLQDLRLAAQILIDKLLTTDLSLGYGLVNLFIPVLTIKEKHEGLHADILQLISTKLSNYLEKIEKKLILSLCTSRYVASQELGNLLLEKNIQLSFLSIKELNSLANSNLLKTRAYILNYYSANVIRIKEEKKDAIMLADGVWEDVRKFAFDFFKTRFNEQDWQPELFVALCDSNKPDVQAYGREMITRWFEKDNGFDYLLKLSQHPDSRMQLFASGFLNQYAKSNYSMLQALGGFLITLLSQVNKGHTAKMRAIQILSDEALLNEENAILISAIFNRMSATDAIQDKALYIKAMLNISKAFPQINIVLKVNETQVYKSKRNNAVQL